VSLTLNELLKTLEKFGVKQIAAADKHFDPTFHQAVMQEPSGEHPDHTVLKELQKGYTLHDRLLRPAMVVVSKAAGAPNDDHNAENPNTH
jgi:molecular chaperone GrpE